MTTEQFASLAVTTLNASMDGAQTSVAVVSATRFPSSAQYRIQIDTELMLITGGAGTTTWTVTRGIEGTSAAPHVSGSRVTHVLTAAALGGQSDPAAGVPGLRSLGTGAQQAAAGNDPRFAVAQINDVTAPAFGAVGDGVTDDTTAVQNAINAGGVTFFPAGKTFLTGKLTIPEAAVLQGVNSGYLDQTLPGNYSIIRLKAGANTHLIDVPVAALGVQIYDLQIDGNKANQTAGTCNVINFSDTGSYTQTQATIQRCFVRNGRSYGIYGGNERGGIKILQTRAYNNSNSTDQLDGIRLMAADNMVAFCSAGLNGGNGVFIGSGPSFVFSNGIWGNFFRGITIASTITEVVIMMNGIDTNARQGLFISANCDTITVVGNTFHTNSQLATNTYPHIEVASTKGTISLMGNQSGPLDGGSTGTPTQLIKLDTGVSVFSHGNVASAGSTTNGVTDDWSHHLTGINAFTGSDASKPLALKVQPGSWALSNDIDGGTLYVYDGSTVTRAAPGKVHALEHLTGGNDAIAWGSVPLDSLGVPAGNINFNSHNAGSVGAVVMTGLTGSTAAMRFVGATASGAPVSGPHLLGDVVVDQTGSIWICTSAGSPGTWVNASSVETARALAAELLLAPKASPTFTGTVTAPEFTASGLTGSTAASRYVGATASGSPASGAHLVGDFVIDQTGSFWICTVAGTPGTWVQVASGGGGGGSPTGAAGGDLGGTYPNPTVTAVEAGVITNAMVNASAAIAESKLSLATDAAVGTGSRRTIGTGSTQAAPGSGSPTMATGLWYSTPGALAPTLVMVENKLYALPFDLFHLSATVIKMGLEITSAGASTSVIRLGIYSDVAGIPTTKLLDAGTIDGTVLFSTTPGAITGLSQVIGPGRVWLAAVSQVQAGTQPTVKALGIGSLLVPKSIQPGGSGQTNTGFVENGTTTSGALPGTFPAGDSGSTIPRVVFST